MNNWQTQLLNHLPEPMRRDPKKAAVLGALLLILGVMMLRQFVFTGAATAKAATKTQANTAKSKSTASEIAKTREAGNSRSASASRVESWLGQPIKPLDRNLFELKLEYLPRSTTGVHDTAPVVADELFWDQLAKSISARADQRKQKQIRSENLQLAASKLRVQSTIMGTTPRALVDGRMVRIGDSVESDPSGASLSFKILRIEARRIVLERDGVKLEVPMGTGNARVIDE